MKQVSIIGIDLAKNSFQLHGAQADGAVVFRKKLHRGKVQARVSAATESRTLRRLACRTTRPGSAIRWKRSAFIRQ